MNGLFKQSQLVSKFWKGTTSVGRFSSTRLTPFSPTTLSLSSRSLSVFWKKKGDKTDKTSKEKSVSASKKAKRREDDDDEDDEDDEDEDEDDEKIYSAEEIKEQTTKAETKDQLESFEYLGSKLRMLKNERTSLEVLRKYSKSSDKPQERKEVVDATKIVFYRLWRLLGLQKEIFLLGSKKETSIDGQNVIRLVKLSEKSESIGLLVFTSQKNLDFFLKTVSKKPGIKKSPEEIMTNTDTVRMDGYTMIKSLSQWKEKHQDKNFDTIVVDPLTDHYFHIKEKEWGYLLDVAEGLKTQYALQTFLSRIPSNLMKDVIQVSHFYLMMTSPLSSDAKDPKDKKIFSKERRLYAYTDLVMAMLYGKHGDFAPKDKSVSFSKITGHELLSLLDKHSSKISGILINQTSEKDFLSFPVNLSDAEEILRFTHK